VPCERRMRRPAEGEDFGDEYDFEQDQPHEDDRWRGRLRYVKRRAATLPRSPALEA